MKKLLALLTVFTLIFAININALQIAGHHFTEYEKITQSDGKILLLGSVVMGGKPHIALARLNSNDTLDTSFGSGGLVKTAIGEFSLPKSIQETNDGKILLQAQIENGRKVEIRYNRNGTLDTTFHDVGFHYLD